MIYQTQHWLQILSCVCVIFWCWCACVCVCWLCIHTGGSGLHSHLMDFCSQHRIWLDKSWEGCKAVHAMVTQPFNLTLPFIPSWPFALCLLYLCLFFCLPLCHGLLSPYLIGVFYLNSVQPLRSHHLPTQKPLPPSSAWLQYPFSLSSCGTIIPFDYVCCGKGIECLYGIWWIYI